MQRPPRKTPISDSIFDAARTAVGDGGGLLDLHLDSILRHYTRRMPQAKLLCGRKPEDIRESLERGEYGQSSKNCDAHCDLPLMKKCGVYGGAIMGIHSRFADSHDAFKDYEQQIRYLDEISETDGFMRIRSLEDWQTAESKKLIGLAPGVEGAHMLGGEEGWERCLLRMKGDGVVYLTLVHSFNNNAAPSNLIPFYNMSPFTDIIPGPTGYPDYNAGGYRLSSMGRELLHALKESGIAIDVAHLHSNALLEVCEWAIEHGVPILCSHTGLRFEEGTMAIKCKGEKVHDPGDQGPFARCFRNLRLEDARAILETGGLIGLFFTPMFIGVGGDYPNTSHRVVQQLNALREGFTDVNVVDHLALGSDYDGSVSLFRDQRDCCDSLKIAYYMLEDDRRGFTADEVKKVFRTNALEFLRRVKGAAAPQNAGAANV